MIELEDEQFENEIINSGSNIALPFDLHLSESGEIRIIAYSFALKTAEEFEKNYSANPFSDEAKNFLREKLTPVMNDLGYDCTSALEKIHLEFRCGSPGMVDTSKVLPGCEIIDTLAGENWVGVSLEDFEIDPAEKIDRMAVIRDGGKIVCFAGLNDVCEEDDFIELTVECAEEYRGRGYGTSCAAALAEYLILLGERVKYICEDSNLASKAVAEGAGFRLCDKRMPFVCYKDCDSEDEDVADEDVLKELI